MVVARCLILATLPMFVVRIALSGDDPPPKDDRELHVVGLYEGATRTGGEIHGPRATVTVDRPGRRVTLVLAAYHTVNWEVKLSPRTNLEQVILGGYEAQVTTGLPASTKVVKAHYQGGSNSLRYCYQLNSPEFRSFLYHLGKLTDQEVASFHGAYAYKSESPFVIDAVQDDPKLLRSYPKPTPLKELPDLKFAGVYIAAAAGRGGFGDWKASYGDFTLGGPNVETLRPLPKEVKRVAYDPANRKLYGVTRGDPVEIDLEGLKAVKMDEGLDVPQIGNIQDVTFDTKRGRLLVATGGGDAYLYAYDVATKTWKVIAEKLGVSSLAYYPKFDCLYGVGASLVPNAPPTLRQFEADGSLIRDHALGDAIVQGSLGRGPVGIGSSTQVVPVNEHVVILTMPDGIRSSEDDAPPKSYMYLFHPKTGQTWLTWKN